MTILEAIKDDHDRMRALARRLLNNIESAPEKRTDILRRLRNEVVPHSRAEEAVLYNNMRRADAETDKVYHGFREHAEVEALLLTLETAEALSVAWKAAAEKFQERLTHHMDEEERDLFPQAKAAFDQEQLEAMALDFKSRKPEYREQNALTNTAEFVGNLVPPAIADKLRTPSGEAGRITQENS
jgi:hemerythrin superfamily protein